MVFFTHEDETTEVSGIDPAHRDGESVAISGPSDFGKETLPASFDGSTPQLRERSCSTMSPSRT